MNRMAVLLALASLLAITSNAFAQEVYGIPETRGSRLVNARIVELRRLSRAAKLGVSATANDTVFVGYSDALSPGQLATNYWSVGAVGGALGTLNGPVQPGTPSGKPRPSQPVAGGQTGTNGIWTWEHPVHGDSLQGWWPVRQYQQRLGGDPTLYTQDYNRPWWAAQYGNTANYVINERRDGSGTSPGDRTFGVVGVWHSDPGNVITSTTPGTNPIAPAWTPIAGTMSAWMGQRGHGDLTAQDAITHNYFNADITDFLGTDQSNTVYANESSKHFPGYGSAQDQMLYRDIAVDNNASNGVTVTFRFRSAMSTGKQVGVTSRTGWFEGDPLQATTGSTATAAGNFISAEAGTPASAQAPCDSFQVYVGEPIGDGSSADTSPGAGWTDSNGQVHTSVYDYARRWFNEVLKKGNRRWLFGVAGNNPKSGSDTTVTLAISGADKVTLQGSTGRLRLVFRVHTNIGYDDENTMFSVSTTYNSGYKGAAQLDEVTVDTGSGATTIGTFEGDLGPGDINNDGGLTALDRWKSTGKPPGTYFHVHSLTDLSARWFDLCGGPTSPTNICNMFGQVISMGNHDDNESNSGPAGTTEENSYMGMFSPAINLAAPAFPAVNNMNLTADMAAATQDYYQFYEIYTGIFDVFTTGCLWQFGFEWYPVRQADGSQCWSGLKRFGCRFFNPDPQCFQDWEYAKGNGTFVTSNSSGVPDSARIFQSRLVECFRFGIADANCGGSGLGLFDNLSFAIVDGQPLPLQVDIWQWFVDTFPFNETASLVGTAGFDTTTALVRAALNISQATGNSTTRYDIAADSIVVNANAGSEQIRLDMIFRIRPGPGNYVTPGDVSSGLRKVPSAAAAYAPGDHSFWDVYSSDPGDKSGLGPSVNPAAAAAAHATAPSGWNTLVWNSARCDTMRAYNVFACLGDGIDPTASGQSRSWTSAYDEDELATHPGRAAYAANNRIALCFVKDTTQSTLNQGNVVCGATPNWIRVKPASKTGWTGDSLTTQGVAILPDGMFTPGTHVEYFFRREDLTGPTAGSVYLCPDTTTVFPQASEDNFDGHRWQEFSVLPDKWKDPAYGGAANACMLYVDWDDRRGDELIWTSVADSIGATSAGDRGNNNGWAAPGGAGLTGEVNNPAYFVNKNRSAGTIWDKYDVKAAESVNNGNNSIGARLSYRTHAGGDLLIGKDARNAPTPDMLKGYYKIILLLSGDLNSNILGPFSDRTANDVGILEDFLLSSTPTAPRGLLCGGSGFVEDANASGGVQEAFVNNYLGVDLNATSGPVGYRVFSGNPTSVADVIPKVADLGVPNLTYGVRNACITTLDVLRVVNGTTTPNAVDAVEYQNYGTNGPYVAVVENKGDAAHPWYTLTEGWDIAALTSRFDINTYGRLQYELLAFQNIFGAICQVATCGIAECLMDVPNSGGIAPYVDFVNSFSSNPLRTGSAAIQFGLAHPDRVEVIVYDVAGRRVRRLADRMFPAGNHSLTWDGVNDEGRLAPRGVYFTQVNYVTRHFSAARKLTLLK